MLHETTEKAQHEKITSFTSFLMQLKNGKLSLDWEYLWWFAFITKTEFNLNSLCIQGTSML